MKAWCKAKLGWHTCQHCLELSLSLSISLGGGHLLEVINRDYSDPRCGTHSGRGGIALPGCAGLFTLRLFHVIGLQRSAPTGELVTSSRKRVWGKVGSSTSLRLIWHPTAGALGSGETPTLAREWISILTEVTLSVQWLLDPMFTSVVFAWSCSKWIIASGSQISYDGYSGL